MVLKYKITMGKQNNMTQEQEIKLWFEQWFTKQQAWYPGDKLHEDLKQAWYAGFNQSKQSLSSSIVSEEEALNYLLYEQPHLKYSKEMQPMNAGFMNGFRWAIKSLNSSRESEPS